LVSAGVAGALNRSGATRAAAWTLLGTSVAAVMTVAYANPRPQAPLDVLVVPVALAGVLLAPYAPLLLASATTLAILGLVSARLALASSPAFEALQPLRALLQPFTLLWLVALLAWMSARSVARALRETDAAARSAAADQALAEQQDLLERGTQALLSVLAQAAGGHPGARADAHPEQPLRQVAVAVNHVLDQLESAEAAGERLRATEHAVDRLSESVSYARAGDRLWWAGPSGTRVDRLAAALNVSRATSVASAAEQHDESGATAPAAHVARSSARVSASSADVWPSPVWPTPPTPQHRPPRELGRRGVEASSPASPVWSEPESRARRAPTTWATHSLPALPPLAPSYVRAAPTVPWSAPASSRPDQAARAPRAEMAPAVEDAPTLVWEPEGSMPTRPLGEALAADEATPAAGRGEADVPATASPTIVHVVPAEGNWPDWPSFMQSLLTDVSATCDTDAASGQGSRDEA
jgi:hypothetical protein